MASTETVSVYTVPSTYVGPYSTDLSIPYRRVVGVQQSSIQAETAWAAVDDHFSDAVYCPADAEQEVLELNPISTERLISFFQRYFVERPLIREGNHSYREEYNCHRFGYWMRGTVVARLPELPEAPDHVVSEGIEVRGSLPKGKHGVLGSRTDYALGGSALHSIVGLGQKSEDCLQVLSGYGFMGIDTYKNVRDWYNKDPSIDVRVYTI